MQDRQYIGFDPGKSGACIIIQNGEIIKFTFPIIGDSKGKEYDIQGILNIFDQFDRKNCHIVIEDVKALQKPMDAGNWALSRGKTILEVACACYGLSFTLVHSKTWQKEIWQGIPLLKDSKGKTDTKNMTLIAVKRLFPKVDLREDVEVKFYADTAQNRKLNRALQPIPRLKEKAHDGIVDALAIAEYCRRKF